MEPSIEITYDPTIKVRGITEELFKQQPEGKFVLKPFTIISKKVYKNFTDRSHAFNYLLKFLKKKSKEDNNVILKVFSEPRKTKTLHRWGLLYFKEFPINLDLYKYLKLFSFISSVNTYIKTDTAINKIIAEHSVFAFKPFEYSRNFIFISLIGIPLFLSQMFSFFSKNRDELMVSMYSFLNILFSIVYGISIARVATTEIIMKEFSSSGSISQNFSILKKLIYSIEKSKAIINKKIIIIVNFDIYSFFDKATSKNLIDYFLNSINENKNISIIFHALDKESINSMKAELSENQFDKSRFFIENTDCIKEFQIFNNKEIEEENLPISYKVYQSNLELKNLQHENQQLEHENKEQLARLIQSAKLESMNITTSGVSHEMRNPLSIIQLVIENLRMEKNLTKEVLLEDLDKIQTQISRIYKLTETFQKFSAQKNLSKKSIDTQITNSLYFFEQRLLSNKIEVNYDKPEERIGGIEFSEELSIVIENLISNAIDALKGNKDAKISIKINSIHSRLDIVFSDNGHGIPQESIKEIFTPLYTTKGPGQGTGLGLWLCYTIIKDNLKGDIRVDSQPNEGTTFTILLPIDGDKDV